MLYAICTCVYSWNNLKSLTEYVKWRCSLPPTGACVHLVSSVVGGVRWTSRSISARVPARPSTYHPHAASLTLLPSEPVSAETRSRKQTLPFLSPALALGLTSPSPALLSPECNPRYSECGSMERWLEQRRGDWRLTCCLEAARGGTPFRDQIALIAWPSSYLLTGRRHL